MDKTLLATLDFITARQVTFFKKANIETAYDLLYTFPTGYDDFTISTYAEAVADETVTVRGFIQSRPYVNRVRNNLTVLSFKVEINNQPVRVAVFNRHFLQSKIKFGKYIRLTGKFDDNKSNFVASHISFDEFAAEISPKFNIKGISDDKVLEIKAKTLRLFNQQITETLPKSLLEKHNLISLARALKFINLPNSMQQVTRASKRIKYEELLSYQLNVKYMLYRRKKDAEGVAIKYDKDKVQAFINSLEFELTRDQKIALDEILLDMRNKYKMNRLLQGEVGSGKTILAAISLYAAVTAGFQGAFMVPTEVLANQHFVTFQELFKDYEGIKIANLTASLATQSRNEILAGLLDGSINIVIGTHSLFQKTVNFANLGLVVTDEEHRFGVRQRVSIVGKGYLIDHLKMSATPIPRTLAISLLGDSDISVLKTLPGKRKPTITEYVPYDERHHVFEHIANEVKAGRQVYIITPMIEESTAMDLSNATEVYENTKKYYTDIAKVGLIHGRLKSEEKQSIMEQFTNNEIQILVATSVIEVGVNVVNATNIIILDADRFGIAQLHQMRGRVRRGDYQSYCFLISKATQEATIKRLKLVEQTSDGFILAEEDLKLRGRGDFFGEKQSGNVAFQLADFLADEELFLLADRDASEIINSLDNSLSTDYQPLLDRAHENYQTTKELLE